ncbi:hypothetical protein HDV00_002673 [Rhizophlyctis rosea]|nr:hypothetical protein HDV00_002673 [Rhizophlyctis rosea]
MANIETQLKLGQTRLEHVLQHLKGYSQQDIFHARDSANRNLLHLLVDLVINSPAFTEFTPTLKAVVEVLCAAHISEHCHRLGKKTLTVHYTVLNLVCNDTHPDDEKMAAAQEEKKIQFCEALMQYNLQDFIAAALTHSRIESEDHLPIHNAAWRGWNRVFHWIWDAVQQRIPTRDLCLERTKYHKGNSTIAHLAADSGNLPLLQYLAEQPKYLYMFKKKNGFHPGGNDSGLDLSDYDEDDSAEAAGLYGCTPYEMAVRARKMGNLGFGEDRKKLAKVVKWFKNVRLDFAGDRRKFDLDWEQDQHQRDIDLSEYINEGQVE